MENLGKLVEKGLQNKLWDRHGRLYLLYYSSSIASSNFLTPLISDFFALTVNHKNDFARRVFKEK